MIDNELDYINVILSGYWKYFKYLCAHKYYVWKFARNFRLKVSILQLLLHDLSKFKPSEFGSYATYYYCKDGLLDGIGFGKSIIEGWLKTDLDFAFNNHQKRNKHHWQYWIMINNSGDSKILEMPEKYINEMIADWCAACHLKTGSYTNIHKWYQENVNDIWILENPSIRKRIENILESIK